MLFFYRVLEFENRKAVCCRRGKRHVVRNILYYYYLNFLNVVFYLAYIIINQMAHENDAPHSGEFYFFKFDFTRSASTSSNQSK